MATENISQEEAESDQASNREGTLVKEYRKVGPAAINAALQCCRKEKKAPPQRSYQPRDEV